MRYCSIVSTMSDMTGTSTLFITFTLSNICNEFLYIRMLNIPWNVLKYHLENVETGAFTKVI